MSSHATYFLRKIWDFKTVWTRFQSAIFFSGMWEVEPGNFWFGKKWFHIKTKPTPICPDRLTEGTNRFINQWGDIDPGIIIECMDNHNEL